MNTERLNMPLKVYPACAVANYFIDKAEEDLIFDLTPLKLMKLVYISHGWCLAIYDVPLN